MSFKEFSLSYLAIWFLKYLFLVKRKGLLGTNSGPQKPLSKLTLGPANYLGGPSEVFILMSLNTFTNTPNFNFRDFSTI